jgi:hypothetical protein
VLERTNLILQNITEIQTRCEGCREKLNHHEQSLYGNGTPGVIARLYSIEQQQEKHHSISLTRAVVIITGISIFFSTAATLIAAWIQRAPAP